MGGVGFGWCGVWVVWGLGGVWFGWCVVWVGWGLGGVGFGWCGAPELGMSYKCVRVMRGVIFSQLLGLLGRVG